MLSFTTMAAAAPSIFEYKGKKFSEEDLETKYKFRLFELKDKEYQGLKGLVEEIALEKHFEDHAKKSKKSVDAVRQQMLSVAEPTDAEVKKFYDENKARIPYPLEKVKSDVARFVKQSAMQEKRKEIVDGLINNGTFKLLADKPIAPKVSINTKGFARRGKSNAKVKVVEFADYKCPHCGHAAQAFKKIYKKYSEKVNFVYIDFPLSKGGLSEKMAAAAYCAGKQGKFWEFHTMVFENQKTLSATSADEFAKKLKIKGDELKACSSSKEATDLVERGRLEGERVGVSGTPAIFINGRRISAHDLEGISAEIETAIKNPKSS